MEQPTITGIIVLGAIALALWLPVILSPFINWNYDKNANNPYRYCPEANQEEWEVM